MNFFIPPEEDTLQREVSQVLRGLLNILFTTTVMTTTTMAAVAAAAKAAMTTTLTLTLTYGLRLLLLLLLLCVFLFYLIRNPCNIENINNTWLDPLVLTNFMKVLRGFGMVNVNLLDTNI